MPLYKTAGITGQFSHAAGSACGGRASTLSFAFHLPANATLVLSPNSRCSSSGLAMNPPSGLVLNTRIAIRFFPGFSTPGRTKYARGFSTHELPPTSVPLM